MQVEAGPFFMGRVPIKKGQSHAKTMTIIPSCERRKKARHCKRQWYRPGTRSDERLKYKYIEKK